MTTDRDCRIGNHVHHGGPHVVVVVRRTVVMIMMMVVTMVMVVVVVMAPTAAEQQRTGDVDGKPEAGNWNRLGEVDRHRREDAAYGFIGDEHGNDRQDDRAGEPGGSPSLPVPNVKRGSSACLRA